MEYNFTSFNTHMHTENGHLYHLQDTTALSPRTWRCIYCSSDRLHYSNPLIWFCPYKYVIDVQLNFKKAVAGLSLGKCSEVPAAVAYINQAYVS